MSGASAMIRPHQVGSHSFVSHWGVIHIEADLSRVSRKFGFETHTFSCLEKGKCN